MPINDDNQRAINSLLTYTAGSSHGRFPEWQEDSDGSIWQFRDTVDMGRARTILDDMFPSIDSDDLLPNHREFVIFRADNTYLYALYRVDIRCHIMRAAGSRYYAHQLRSLGKKTPVASQVHATIKEMYGHQLGIDYHI